MEAVDQARRNRRAEYAHEFPCYGYEYVESWGMESTGAQYLYARDIAKMAAKLKGE